ncbi:unnamed protein product [Ilex paraguariensis]|uniref:Uncharacterized protein n=1 Tax=Ilex paraguariensis TaxID=185542 RepID=A0ABC8TLM7_9AQUA
MDHTLVSSDQASFPPILASIQPKSRFSGGSQLKIGVMMRDSQMGVMMMNLDFFSCHWRRKRFHHYSCAFRLKYQIVRVVFIFVWCSLFLSVFLTPSELYQGDDFFMIASTICSVRFCAYLLILIPFSRD